MNRTRLLIIGNAALVAALFFDRGDSFRLALFAVAAVSIGSVAALYAAD